MLAKSLLALFALLMLGYAGLCALLHFKQRDLIYYPATTTVPTSATDFKLVREAVTLRGWRLNPGKDRALIYFGGNAERLEASREEALAAARAKAAPESNRLLSATSPAQLFNIEPLPCIAGF